MQRYTISKLSNMLFAYELDRRLQAQKRAFEKAEIAKFNQADLDHYENSLTSYRDLKSVIDTAFDEGKIAVAKNLKTLGVDIEIISQSTGLTKGEISKL